MSDINERGIIKLGMYTRLEHHGLAQQLNSHFSSDIVKKTAASLSVLSHRLEAPGGTCPRCCQRFIKDSNRHRHDVILCISICIYTHAHMYALEAESIDYNNQSDKFGR